MQNFSEQLIKNLRSIPVGIMIGWVSAGIFVCAALGGFGNVIEKYAGSLLTSMSAMLASAFALSGVFANIRNQDRIKEEDRRRKLNKAKAGLPQVLAGFGVLVGQIIEKHLDFLLSNIDEPAFSAFILEIEPNMQAIESLKEIIEHADVSDSKYLADLISLYQISLSRTKSERGLVNQNECDIGNLTDWIFLRGMIEGSFEYARGMTEHILREDVTQRLPRRISLAFLPEELRIQEAVMKRLKDYELPFVARPAP